MKTQSGLITSLFYKMFYRNFHLACSFTTVFANTSKKTLNQKKARKYEVQITPHLTIRKNKIWTKKPCVSWGTSILNGMVSQEFLLLRCTCFKMLYLNIASQYQSKDERQCLRKTNIWLQSVRWIYHQCNKV